MQKESIERRLTVLKGQLAQLCDQQDSTERTIRQLEAKLEEIVLNRRWAEGQLAVLNSLIAEWETDGTPNTDEKEEKANG
ncbi:MAG: hypothetical protein AB1760_00305 [Pseudomonadota bacterium]